MKEFVKYRPENITPREFMRPPTEPFAEPLAAVCLQQEQIITEKAERVACDVFGVKASPSLRIGTELELLLFSSDSNPPVDKLKKRKDNPNYNKEHYKRVDNLKKRITRVPDEGGLGDLILGDVTRLKIFMEVRTPPTDVMNYFHAIQEIKTWFKDRTEEGGMNPVIFSQHFHLSITDINEKINLLAYRKGGLSTGRKGLLDVYHRAYPLLRLPEAIEQPQLEIYTKMGAQSTGVKIKGSSSYDNYDPIRLEGRVTNNDYAFDPQLNLLFQLIGIRRGLEHYINPSMIDRDNPLEKNYDTQSHYFSIPPGTSYLDLHAQVKKDKVLPSVMPEALLHGICDVMESYPEVSKGLRSKASVRDQAYAAVSK